jgi:pimeloyl-ACP methyl ester carboxylesterase
MNNYVTKLAAGLLAAAAFTAPAYAAPAKNVILVHGALADGSGWKGVYDSLVKKGFNVSVVQEPETSLADDVEATRRAIAQQDGPVVLVGHSYGGQIITEAGDDPKVSALVYVAAVAPDVGESLNDLFKKFTQPTHDIAPIGDGSFLMLKPEKFHADFAADIPADDGNFLGVSQVLIAAKVFETPTKVASWKTKPSYGIVAEKDMISGPEIERWMYKRANMKVTEVATASHAVYISQPAKVAAVIEEAAGH